MKIGHAGPEQSSATATLTNRHEVVSQSVAQEQRPTCERMGAQQVAETRGGAHASKHWYGTRQIISSATRTLPSGVTSRGDLPATAQPAPGQSPLPTSLASSSFPSPPRSPPPALPASFPLPTLSSPRARTIGFLITHPTETVLCSHTTPLLPLQGRPARQLAASSRLESVPAWCLDRPRPPLTVVVVVLRRRGGRGARVWFVQAGGRGFCCDCDGGGDVRG